MSKANNVFGVSTLDLRSAVMNYRRPVAGRPGVVTVAVQAIVAAVLSFGVAFYVAQGVAGLLAYGRTTAGIAAGVILAETWLMGALAATRRPRVWGVGVGLWIGAGAMAVALAGWVVMGK